jgi:hypothetical protein
VKSQTTMEQVWSKKLFGSKKGIINFWIGIIAWVGWFLLNLFQDMQMHQIVDPSYNPWDDGPLQISLSLETIGYLLILGPTCLISFPFGFQSWWRERMGNNRPYIFDVIGCFLTGGFLIYPCGWMILAILLR